MQSTWHAHIGSTGELLSADAVRDRSDPPDSAAAPPSRGVRAHNRACLWWGLPPRLPRPRVTIYEGTRINTLAQSKSGRVRATAPYGSVTAENVALATNAAPSLLRRLRLYTVPVGDYAILTELLSPEHRASLGWEGREAMTDGGNQFHYFRLTMDKRPLWGGYDVIDLDGSAQGPEARPAPANIHKFTTKLIHTFPGLSGIRVSHTWAARSIPPRASTPSSALPFAAGWRTRSATPASGSKPPDSAPTSYSTCWPANRHNAPGSPWCGPNRSCSHPNRCATSASN